jgi:hypothetical protein
MDDENPNRKEQKKPINKLCILFADDEEKESK